MQHELKSNATDAIQELSNKIAPGGIFILVNSIVDARQTLSSEFNVVKGKGTPNFMPAIRGTGLVVDRDSPYAFARGPLLICVVRTQAKSNLC